MFIVLPVVVLSFVFLSTSAFTTNTPDKNKNNNTKIEQNQDQKKLEDQKKLDDQNKIMETKKKDIQIKFEKLKGLSKEELGKNLKSLRQELKTWADQNKIDLNKMDLKSIFPSDIDLKGIDLKSTFPEVNNTNNKTMQEDQNKPKFKSISAVYGTDKKSYDISSKLSSMISGDKLTITASNSIAGDPDPETVKKLTIIYESNGKRHMIVIPEDNIVTLPQI